MWRKLWSTPRQMLESLQDAVARGWSDLLTRAGGPFSFRFILQPTMSALLAVRDGLQDARAGRPAYLWTILRDSAHRSERLREGMSATARIVVLGLAMDALYQARELRTFYPLEALLVAFGLALVPYTLIRGPVTRLALWWHHRRHSRNT